MSRHALGHARGHRSTRSRDERGASAVEFALVLPILVLFLFGIITYGYMFSVRQALTQAAAEGARAAAVAPAGHSSSKAVQAVNSALGGLNLTCGTGGLVCTPVEQTCDGDPCMKITVDYAYAANAPVRFPLIPLPDALSFTSSAKVN
jgi:Flp pilus assembly protein TadG